MRIIFKILLVLALISNLTELRAENSNAKALIKEKLSKMAPEDYINLQKPKYISEEKKALYLEAASKISPKISERPKLQSEIIEMDSLPANFRVPGEFEESQAVFISWPSYAYDAQGNSVDPFTPGFGLKWQMDQFGNWFYEIVPIEGYVLDLEPNSPYPGLWAQLADAIQKEVPVWLRIAAPEDSTALKQYMLSVGRELVNYKFLTDEDGENAFWARDFGPFGAYYGDDDSLMFVIAEYYPNRPIDDNFPVKMAQQFGYKYYKSPLELEGGNFMTDGYGSGFYGDVVFNNNSDIEGVGTNNKTPMTSTQVNEEMSRIFHLQKRNIMTSLRCDGGTGHIDIYTKMANDQEILITKYPDQFNKPLFSDYQTANQNRQMISERTTAFNSRFRFLEVPLPTDDNGTYARTTCNTFREDARGYINGLTINKTFIVPTYSNQTSGNKEGDAGAIEVIKRHMPGYNVVPIDSRILTPLGGAIHCITMQIPAENPVVIRHRQLSGSLSKFDVLVDNKIEIKGTTRNNSGFEYGKLYYRCVSQGSTWNTANLTITQDISSSKSEHSFTGVIDFENLGCGLNSEIEYYLEFETMNGKTALKPITAPRGFYSFNLNDNPSDVEESFSDNIIIYPNPAIETAYINAPINGQNFTIEIYNSIGNILDSITIESSPNIASLNLSKYSSGVYFVKVQINGRSEFRKLIISK